MEILGDVWDLENPLQHKRIVIVRTLDQCQRMVNMIKLQTAQYTVLGFDCEWIVRGQRRPVALLQLATKQGLCVLFRLCALEHVPASLRGLLETDSLIKVGVAPQDDAMKLLGDYGVDVTSTFDLRFLAAMTGHRTVGIAKLAQSILQLTLDKHPKIVCSNWEEKLLTKRQMDYAANDAFVAVGIFQKLAAELLQNSHSMPPDGSIDIAAVQERLKPFYEIVFKDNYTECLYALTNATSQAGGNLNSQQDPLQKGDCNCQLVSPDNELICSVNVHLALWYLHENLAFKTCDNPLTLRLLIGPEANNQFEEWRQIQPKKPKQCVVCGRLEACTRKNVVPNEYRKYYPTVLKSRTLYDTILLCLECEQKSIICNKTLQERLALMCEAPLNLIENFTKYRSDLSSSKIKLAAQDLLFNYSRISIHKRDNLEYLLKKHFNVQNLTREHLQTAMSYNLNFDKMKFLEHGKKVVMKYMEESGGLMEFQLLWRQHFLDTMEPKYLPNHFFPYRSKRHT